MCEFLVISLHGEERNARFNIRNVAQVALELRLAGRGLPSPFALAGSCARHGVAVNGLDAALTIGRAQELVHVLRVVGRGLQTQVGGVLEQLRSLRRSEGSLLFMQSSDSSRPLLALQFHFIL